MYINSSMAKVEALKGGYDEAILLSPQGYVSECTGENLFIVDDEVRHMINSKSTTVELRKRAREMGMRTLRDDGVGKVLAGLTRRIDSALHGHAVTDPQSLELTREALK